MKRTKWTALLAMFCLLCLVSCSNEGEVTDGFTEIETGKGQVGTNTGESCVTAGISEYTSTSATMYGYINVTDDVMQTAKFGFIWTRSKSELSYEKNEGMTLVNETTGSQYFTKVKGFTPGRTYYYRAFVKIGSNYVYGIIKEFKTLTPTVHTVDANADITSATLNGRVSISDGDEYECGFYYTTNESNFDKYKKSTQCKTPSKEFSSIITNITPGQKYFYQAYVNVGDTTICGKIEDFTAKQPTVTTLDPSRIGCFYAELAGKTNTTGLSVQYEIGESSKDLEHTTSSNLITLAPNTTYYYRAVYGDVKGEIKSFKTLSPEIKMSDEIISEGSRIIISANSNLTAQDASMSNIYFEYDTSSEMTSPYSSNYASIDADGNILAYASTNRDTKYYARAVVRYYDLEYNVAFYKSDIISFTTPLVANNGHEYVDLGLKSKTLWATCNVGATTASENGSYLTEKYNPKESWGGEWTKPTKQQFEELINDCKWTLVGDGYKVTGPNGNSITLPLTGSKMGTGVTKIGSEAYYWTSTYYSNNKYYYCHIYSNGTKQVIGVASSSSYSYRLVINR